MGQTESKKKIEEQFEIYRIERDGNSLLKSRKDNKEYLMRVVTCASVADLERLKALLECRAQLRNQHILSLVEIKEKQQDFLCSIHYKMFLVLEYSFKNLAQEMRERCASPQRMPFQESDLWSILYSCCSALSTLYSSGATHESLSAEQVFINKDGFVKITQPLLFGLEKNHLEAMQAREEEGAVGVHLSPQIIGCLDDQNFFYYDKEKSDIFILAMIVVDLALLSNHFLYDSQQKKPLFEQIEVLLDQVGERYSHNLVAVLGQMLRIESRMRPNLAQIIEKVEKYNNIGQDFTVQSESNLKSHAILEREHERVIYQRPVKYQDLSIREDILEKSKKREAVASNMFTAGGHSMQYQSLCIKEPSPAFNQQNFDGRVFASTPHHSHYNQTLFTSHHQYVSAANYYQSAPFYAPSNPISTPANVTVIPPSSNLHVNFNSPGPAKVINSFNPAITQSPPAPANNTTQRYLGSGLQQQNYNLYQRSKSIDSIKVVSSQYSRVDQVKGFQQSATKPTPYNFQPKEAEPVSKPRYQPLFTHQIPEVYNILVKNSQTAQKVDLFSKQEREIIQSGNEHVATPQFQGDLTKANRFTSFKNFPYETVSRSGQQPQSPLIQGQPLQLRKNLSHTQSENQPTYAQKQFQRTPPDPFAANCNNNRNPFTGSSATPFKPPPNPFAGSTPFPSQNPPTSNFAFSNSNAAYNNSSPIVSASFIPAMPSPVRQAESFTCRSGFSHLAHFPPDDEDIKLQFVKEDIEERGRYEGYKFNGQRNGHGTLYFKDGGHYEGEWKSDKMHGFGKLYYQNGKIAYEGHWENDEFNGQGRVYNSQPVSFQEEFNYKDFSQLGNQWVYYEGQFKNDSKHGKGYIKLSNGEMFQGIFDHDMIEGNGIFYKRTGEIVIGFWIDNKLFLNQSYEHDKK